MLTPEYIQEFEKVIKLYEDGKSIHQDVNYLEAMKEVQGYLYQQLEFGNTEEIITAISDITDALLTYEAFTLKVIDRGMKFVVNTLPKKKKPSTWKMIKEHIIKPAIQSFKRRMV